MKNKNTKSKIIALTLSTVMVVSAIAYQGVVNAAPTPNTATTLSTPLAVGETFTANIKNNGVENLPCLFRVTRVASGTTPGEVHVGDHGVSIATSTTGTITIPNTISDGTNTYTVTSVGDFFECTGITNTGLENNTTLQ